jgi:hypothetical protein
LNHEDKPSDDDCSLSSDGQCVRENGNNDNEKGEDHHNKSANDSSGDGGKSSTDDEKKSDKSNESGAGKSGDGNENENERDLCNSNDDGDNSRKDNNDDNKKNFNDDSKDEESDATNNEEEELQILARQLKENPPDIGLWGDRAVCESFYSGPAREDNVFLCVYPSMLGSLSNEEILWDVRAVNTFINAILICTIPKEIYIHPTVLRLSQTPTNNGVSAFDETWLSEIEDEKKIRESKVAMFLCISQSRSKRIEKPNHIGLLVLNNNPPNYPTHSKVPQRYAQTLVMYDPCNQFDRDSFKGILEKFATQFISNSNTSLQYGTAKKDQTRPQSECFLMMKSEIKDASNLSCAPLALHKMIEILERIGAKFPTGIDWKSPSRSETAKKKESSIC